MSDMVEAGNPFSMPRETRIDSYPSDYAPKPGADTLLHLGCVASYQDVKIIPAVMKILKAAGIDFTTLGKQENCCGYLAYLVGDMDTFHKVAGANAQLFKDQGVRTLLTTCAGCYKTFEELYPKHGHGDGYKPEHVVFLLERLINQGKLGFDPQGAPLKAIYHDPCDLGRHMGGLRAAPRGDQGPARGGALGVPPEPHPGQVLRGRRRGQGLCQRAGRGHRL